MARGVRWYLVGSLAVVALAGCGRGFMPFAERDAWRNEAETACIKSGAIKEGPAVTPIKAIEGPGICGAHYPLKVAALGDSTALGYADELRPPGSVPGFPAAAPRAPSAAQPYPPQSYPPQTYPQPYPQPYARQPYPQQTYAPEPPGGPMSINPPGTEEFDSDEEGEIVAPTPNYGAPRAAERAPSVPPSYPQRPLAAPPPTSYPSPPVANRPYQSYPAEQVPLAPSRAPLTGSATVQPAATLACPLVSALDTWVASGVQPAALRWFGQPVAEIKQISAYSCRSMNGQRGAPISEHAFGNALDIAAFTLADGRKVTVKDGWRGLPEEQGFLRDVHVAACRQFATVLAPGSNAFHYDHIHVDLARRASGRQVCNPAAVPGDAIAARLGYPRAAQRADPHVTGSIERPQRTMRTFRTLPGRDEVYDGLPRAVPGED
jgi:extensin-like protein